MIYTIYQVKCKVNDKIYIGVHGCRSNCRHKRNNKCYYMGSGTVISRAHKKYEKDSFSKEILFEYKTKKEAMEKEAEIVNKEFVLREDTYNQTVGGNMPPDMTGYKHTQENKDKIGKSSKQRSNDLSKTAKDTMDKKFKNGGWTEEEIRKRVETRKLKNNYGNMKECNTEESIKKRVETRRKNGNYDNYDNSHLKEPEIVFKRTRTRIINSIRNKGKIVPKEILEKYNINKDDLK